MSSSRSDVTAADEFVRSFDDAWSRNDVAAALALFAEDATLESPLVQRLLHQPTGVLRGREEIRAMVEALMAGGKAWGGHEAPVVRGSTVMIEFKGAGTDDHYSVDVIELRDGKIQSLRAYAGWRAFASKPSG